MDLPCLPWQDHVARKWAGLEPEFRERFKSLLEIEDIFESALSVTNKDDAERLRRISAEGHDDTRKGAAEASACRERGNASFKRGEYAEAALHYSQGVCLSPQSSEQLSLCYANRSAALYHLQHYQDALEDVSDAEKSGYPPALAHKLAARRAQCRARLPSSSVAAEPDDRSGTSPKVAVRFSPEKGRHMVATEAIAAGEVILSERPFGSVLVASDGAFGTERRHCHACLKPARRLVPCAGCSYARYCGARCRDGAWEEHHRWECPLGARLSAAGVLSHLALRVALKAGVANAGGAAYRGVWDLLHHVERHAASMRFLCAVTAATLRLALGETATSPVGRAEDAGGRLLGVAMLRHALQLRCNAQAVVTLQQPGLSDAHVQSVEERRVATAVFPTLSLINHSCRPNTSLSFGAGGAVTLRAARSLRPGQEVAHCYGPHSSRMVTGERRRLLQEQYFFLCRCEACQEDRSPDEESGLLCARCDASLLPSSGGDHSCGSCGGAWSGGELSQTLRDVRRDLDAAAHLLETEQPGEAAVLLERSQARWRRAGVAPARTHELSGRTEDALARAHAHKGDWARAAEHLELSAAAVAARFGADSVEMARQVAKLAQLHFNAGSRASALSVIPEARRLLALHCGALCPEVRELQAMEDCLRR
ncbi:SET and MYND domain-containing protein 4 isoform X1 [Hippocampus zosterae]|uniref:SET and MYND domain-containing protein 4 isoform X1 n=1 Tax=Hippocampus zosterae TaxID=109293 RepID=UPI00223D9682|nr:SET and MYND domain-containing protein 4 isoform X1 [Hippocampus zosterae]